ncbi:hypothetical protein D9601_10325 [Sphingomonas sp. MA1305]|uniref:hypothetical protein n=1 Tax=Sphingomonas sp. MA1305 TaxID=2479204 RepID=UPI0018DFCBCF|nr:hypothetical protein [Sphingomonas sp. MA1305]MBI0475747.1 hypothetical protein [Sphingomonas sp. MA1305]
MADDSYPHAPALGKTDTSAEAAASLEGVTARLQRMVRAVIAEAGPNGATGDEIAAKLDWHRFRVRPRTSELRAMKKIADSGLRRRNPDSGCKAIVWVLPQYKQEDAA